MTELLQIDKLSVSVDGDHHRDPHRLLQPISLTLKKNRALGIVGESGSGKSLLVRTILGLLPENLQAKGRIFFQGQDLLQNDAAQWQKIRGRNISLIIQNAMSAFDPRLTLGAQFNETLRYHTVLNETDCRHLAIDSLRRVNLASPQQLLTRYPHQLSGGQLQRMMIAIALALTPEIIIADEPTTALDAITQFEILQQFKQITTQNMSTLIFITHDLGLLRHLADDIAVIHQGALVEYCDTQSLWDSPQHPYTRFLLDTRQQLTKRFNTIMGRRHVT